MSKTHSVLVVEDDGLIAMHLSEMLEHAGYTVLSAEFTGEHALARLENPPLPDVIIMDIGLSGKMDGIQAARQIRTKYDIPVIFLTAYSSEVRIAEAKEVSSFYLFKPCLENDLETAIERALSH